MNHRSPQHIRELDGIRALAVGLVLITHLFGNADLVPEAWILGVPAPLRLVITHGWLGVDLFFVLSGLLITGILLEAKGKPDYFRGFYIRRALRILPLYYAVLIVLIAACGFKQYATYWTFALGLSANLSTLLHATIPTAAGPAWSLAVEEQFYLFWPLVVLLLSRRRLAFVAIAIVVIEPILRYRFGTDQIFYPWCRFDGLAIGALLALWFSNRTFTARQTLQMAAGLVSVSLVMMLSAAPFGGFEPGALSTALRISEGTLVFGALVATALALRETRATSALRSRAARVVADLSFCLYLVHVPLLLLFEFVSHSVLPIIAGWQPAFLVPLRAVIVFAVALGVAQLSRHYLELPFMRLRTVLLPVARTTGPENGQDRGNSPLDDIGVPTVRA